MTETGKTAAQGIGARLLRKEDARYLHGRGSFVADIDLPNIQEVAFLRSPVAHALIKPIHVPDDLVDRTYSANDLTVVNPVEAKSSIPKFKPS